MLSYNYLLDIALILLATKLLGLFTRKIHMPQVVGALMAGLIMGPAVLNILRETDFIRQTAELGVIVLMFTAGLETDIKELKKSGKASLIIALAGVLLPLAGGVLVAMLSGLSGESGTRELLQNIFIGIILTATSVSISVETLKELGKLNTRAGNVILGAALIDDILGIIVLTVISSFADESVNILKVMLMVALYFVFIVAVGYAAYRIFNLWINRHNKDMRRFVVVAFAFCLLFAFISEKVFGMADITGAYFAGLVICNTQRTKYIMSRFETISYMFLSPIFFASIGIEVVLPTMSLKIIVFSVVLMAVAVLTKVIGCGFGAKLCGYTNAESLQIGVGMVSRGEVALIVTSRGFALGLISAVFFGPIILMVVFTTVITPVLLKLVFKSKKESKYTGLVESKLIDNYEETEQLDLTVQSLLKLNDEMKTENEKKKG